MTAYESISVRGRIRERLAMNPQPYTNEINTKGKGLSVSWMFWLMVAVAIVGTIKGW